jgi:hypothetical protein
MSIFDKYIPNELTGGLDKLGDMLVPKELAPFLGPAAMMFAGPLGPFASLALGQLGSIKMNSGKLDPFTALGTTMAGRASGYTGTTLDDRLGAGIGTLFDGTKGNADLFAGFRKGFTPNVGQNTANVTLADTANPKKEMISNSSVDPNDPFSTAYQYTDPNDPFSTAYTDLPVAKEPTFIDKTIKGAVEGFDEISKKAFPGFKGEDDKFSLLNSLTTIGSATTLSQLMPMAEALKKQKIEDEKQEGSVWQKWFESYKNSTGRSYGDSPYPDSAVMSKWKKYGEPLGLAMGGRVGYNQGGDTGIIAAAPGMPEGMQLDGRDGLFISQGVEEKADDVPAMLSKNEFVLTADAMKGFDKMSGGSGDPRAAAQKMYQFMDQMEAIA